MRQYRPTIEELKKRYSADMARRKMQARRDAARDPKARPVSIPDNSEPWLPHKPRSLAECIWVAAQVATRTEQWKKNFLPMVPGTDKNATRISGVIAGLRRVFDRPS